MPEGDTIWRAARTLQRAIGGRVVTRFETVLVKPARVNEDTPVAGRVVEGVESAGFVATAVGFQMRRVAPVVEMEPDTEPDEEESA